MFYKVVVQAVIIFRAKMWVMTPCMGWALGGGFNTGYIERSLVGIPSGYWTGDGTIHLYRR